jgi:large subunit ribosomal protein L1
MDNVAPDGAAEPAAGSGAPEKDAAPITKEEAKPKAKGKGAKPTAQKKPSGPRESAAPGRRERGRSMRGRSRRHAENLKKVEFRKPYPLDEGIKLLKGVAGGTKFTQTVNLVMSLGIDPKHADQMIRGAVSLPKGIGKTKRVIAFCEGEDVDTALAAGAIEAGVEELVKKISGGWMDFDVAIAHPRAMGKVGKLGRVLGPQGKMPSPKNGTVTPNVENAVREFVAGKIEFRNDSGANVHTVVGRVDFSDEDLKENINAFIDHIRKLKPTASKGAYIKAVHISGSMSPAIQLQVAQ